MHSNPSKSLPASGCIQIRGARQNNLKGFDLDLPLNQLNVLTGPSGSGKSSLAFNTIYAEGQRRYVETFSPYTRQFLERMDKPKVDEIRGIPPAIAIEQANSVKTSRSTVGTMTEINDYLKVLFPKIAQAACPSCQRNISPETERSIVEKLFASAPDAAPAQRSSELLVTFGVPVPAGTNPGDFFAFLQQQGYLRVWLEDRVQRTDEIEAGRRTSRLPGLVHVIQDRVSLSEANRPRIQEAVETALRFGKGKIALVIPATGEIVPFSTGWHCAYCDLEITPPTPGLFSFNHPLGACPTCRGFGRVIAIDFNRAIPDRSLSLAQGAIKPFQTESGKECQRDLMRCAAKSEIDVHCAFDKLPASDQRWVIHGERPNATPDELWNSGLWYGVKGFFDYLESKAYKMHVRVLLSRYRAYTTCTDCNGSRFQPAALNFRLAGKTLPELSAMPVTELAAILADVQAGMQSGLGNNPAVKTLAQEIATRVNYLVEVGVGYLSLDRQTRTLSGGEVERVNLTTCLGASLVNTLFVLDEPTVGLHPRDVERMVRVMKELRDRGNTLLVVEHDEAVMRAADNLIELGPGRGDSGGDLVFNGPLSAMKDSLTADYLQGRKAIPVPKERRKPNGWLKLKGVTHHNLKELDVSFPLGVFACVTGVSGSGKSTLIHDVLYQNLLRRKGLAPEEEEMGFCRKIEGDDRFESVVMVDQSPLSRSPRSNPALYLGIFDAIRDLFSKLPESLAQGLSSSSFSFNSGNGRCERCGGAGCEKIEMQFLSDLFVRCPECDGKRFQAPILAIHLEGKSIHDILEMSIAEAIAFFRRLGEDRIAKPLEVLDEVGLSYLRLGQPLTFLSGGESQRLKLVSHLTRGTGVKSLLLLDEPTTGLHLDDIAVLVRVFERLVQQGNSLLVIEHNDEVIKCADYLVDLGPEAGAEGGRIVAAGTPEQVAKVKLSHTGRFVAAALGKKQPLTLHVPRSPQLLRESVEIHGAREHNLKNVSLEIPRGKNVVITGLSGSGKSTLAFDILFAEGQRRFLDSMSPYARQFVEQLEKPDVDLINGLPPTVAIEQRVTRGGGKSTVATVTEIYHFLRLLFAKVGVQFCPKCNVAVEKQSQSAILKQAEAIARKGSVKILASLVKARKGFHTEVAQWARKQGFDTLLVDGRWVATEGFEKLDRFREHSLDLLVGSGKDRNVLKKALERALEIGRGTVRLLDSRNISTILSTEMSCPECGQSFEELDPRQFSFNSVHGWCEQCHGFGEIWDLAPNTKAESALEMELDEERRHEQLEEGEAKPCPGCAGSRLNPVARNVLIQGLAMEEFVNREVRHSAEALRKLKFSGNAALIARDILAEIDQRLRFLGNVGLDYLQLSRSAKTLSGGESQRIRLAAQLGSNLRGVLYILDEPTIGLHPHDNLALLATLDALKSKGNSLLVVEHDEETMRRADLIIDLGPKAGAHGGEVVAIGSAKQIMENPASLTGKFLANPLQHPTRGTRRPFQEVQRWLEIKGARANNLKNMDVQFPVGRLSVITGVSGSGKSTLMRRVLRPAVEAALSKKKQTTPTSLQAFSGSQFLEAVYEIDQTPIGKTSRSIPATYIGFFDEIRKQFAQVPLARIRGYTASRFSFNNDGGRCEKCQGQGVIKVEMNFLPTSYLPCDSCIGKRYNPGTLEVLYNEKSIGDVLDLTFEEAASFFHAIPSIHRPLALLVETGLGYLKLGQPSPTLSGGEAQRLKLVTELTRGIGRTTHTRLRKGKEPKSTLYLLEEPTIGLHMADVAELLKVLHRLVDDGHTVLVIEHNLSLIADADYIVDIGPNAGDDGGTLVATGSPEEVALCEASRTASFLRDLLGTSCKELPGKGKGLVRQRKGEPKLKLN